MPPLLQAKLLHVLQDQQFSRLGSRSVVKVDVRILAATNINIPEALASKRLREDLYYRLNAFTLQLPPLRERKEEIPILLKHFMSRMAEQYARPSAAALAQHAAGVPGLFLARQSARAEQLHQALPGAGRREAGHSGTAAEQRRPRRATVTLAHTPAEARIGRTEIAGAQRQGRSRSRSHPQALDQTNWNRKQAAALLQISYKALLYKIRQYGIAQQSGGHHKLSAGA